MPVFMTPDEIERALPKFVFRTREEYEQMAREARAAGESCTWADVRLADLCRDLPRSDEVQDVATVRRVHLWYLAYQRVLVADLDSEHPEVQDAAKREILRLRARRGPLPLHHVRGGES